MSDYKAEIEKFETTKRFSGSAHTIKTKLEPLKSHIEVARNRWFWELLQNAHDYNDKVEIEVNVRIKSSRNYSKTCNPYFEITGLQHPFKPAFTAEISPIDKELTYRLMDIFKEKNIPIQHVLLNNCMHKPWQFEDFKTEFEQQLNK